jgi:hypothetical protein
MKKEIIGYHTAPLKSILKDVLDNFSIDTLCNSDTKETCVEEKWKCSKQKCRRIKVTIIVELDKKTSPSTQDTKNE